MPIVDEKAPRECDFDAMLTELKGTDQNTACVFNCQVDISPHIIAVEYAIIYAMFPNSPVFRWARAAPPRA